MPRALILGGSGQIGRALAARLLADGWDVAAAHRGQKQLPADLVARGAREIHSDRATPGALAQAIGQGVDALIDTIAFAPEDGAQLLAVQGKVGAFIVISSASVYCDEAGRTLDEARAHGWPEFTAPLTEESRTVPPGPQTYSTRKVALEEALLSGANRPITILRPGAIHGPGSPNPREYWFIKRALDGRTYVPLKWNGAHALAPTFVGNVAALIAKALEAPATRVLNITDPHPPNVIEIGAAIAAAMNHKWTLAPFPGEAGRSVGHTPWSLPMPVPIDISAAAALGYRPVATYAEAVAQYWRAMADDLADRNGQEALMWPVDPFDYAAEDASRAALA